MASVLFPGEYLFKKLENISIKRRRLTRLLGGNRCSPSMLSGGLTQFCCGDPNGRFIPPSLRAQRDCALVEWEGETQGHPVIYQRTFCEDEGHDGEREDQAMERAQSFVRDNYELRFIDSYWRFVGAARRSIEEESFVAKAILWGLETLLSVSQTLDRIFKD